MGETVSAKGERERVAAKIMKASIFLLVLASASAAPQFEGLKNIFSALSGNDEPGEVNGDYEQVPYTTLKKFDGYEMRQYPSVKWVCTDVTYKMNKEEEEVEMTVPVLSRMKLQSEGMVNKQMCFYLNKKHQANPPTPTDPAVKIEQNKEFTVYVHNFGGYAMSDSVNLREARRFAEVLRNAGEEVDTDLFYTAGYDSPMKFWNRRNEVMYLVPGNDL